MKMLKVKLNRSTIGCTDRQQATVLGLGLRKVRQERVLENTPAVRGMIKQVLHLIDVTEVDVDPSAGR
jgi:large subunit ribosomal protein L30